MKVFLEIAGRFVPINQPGVGWKYTNNDNFLVLEYDNWST
jgi:hypothetical protein